MKDLQVDRDRAIKLAAMAGLALLAVTILPGLLRTPDPPQIPSDVGFLPSETRGAPLLPNSNKAPAEPERDLRDRGKRADEKRRGGERANRRSKAMDRSRNRPDRPPQHPSEAKRRAESSVSEPPRDPDPQPPLNPPVSVPSTVPAPPPTPPAPPVRTPAMPADGSQEFAPRQGLSAD